MKFMFLISAQLQSGKDAFGEALRKSICATAVAFASPVTEVAIALDTTLACDTPGISEDERVTQLGAGVGIKHLR